MCLLLKYIIIKLTVLKIFSTMDIIIDIDTDEVADKDTCMLTDKHLNNDNFVELLFDNFSCTVCIDDLKCAIDAFHQKRKLNEL